MSEAFSKQGTVNPGGLCDLLCLKKLLLRVQCPLEMCFGFCWNVLSADTEEWGNGRAIFAQHPHLLPGPALSKSVLESKEVKRAQ